MKKDKNSGEKKTKREIVRRILFWISLCVFILAVGKLGHIGYTYWKNNRGYQDIRESAQLGSKESGEQGTNGSQNASQGGVDVIINSEGINQEIRTQEGFPSDWEPSAKLKEAMDIYRKHTVTTASLLLEGMRKGVENLRKFLSEVDLFAVDKNDKPVYQVATVTSALKQIPDLAKALSDAEKALAKDFMSDDKARGNSVKAIGEDI